MPPRSAACVITLAGGQNIFADVDDDWTTVSWEEGKKKPKTRQLSNMTATGALGGTFWGMLFGLIFFMVRQLLITSGVGPTLVEISDHPLSPAAVLSISLEKPPYVCHT